MQYNYSKLHVRIVEKVGTQANVAEKLGLSERSMSLKLNGRVGWKQTEISKACEILEILPAEIPAYFFTI